MALASAWHVLGCLRMNSADAYRQAAGMGPPNTSAVPLSERVSLMSLTSPLCSSMVMIGSVLLMASSWPERNADKAPAEVPTPTKLTSSLFTPPRDSTRLAIMLVDEPGDETPTRQPLSSDTDLKSGRFFVETPKTICGALPCSTKA